MLGCKPRLPAKHAVKPYPHEFVLGLLTMNAIGTVSRTATLVRGIENIFAPCGKELPEGSVVPHWYNTYVSFTTRFLTT